MRLLHTSDWHLGQNFKGYDRHVEHQAFLDWLLTTLAERQIDALLIAGDIFDQANPGAAAQALFYRFLAQARAKCPQLDIVVIAGNHDSAARIDAPHAVLIELGVHVVGHFSARDTLDDTSLQRVCIPLKKRDGSIGAWALALPFLRPGDLASSQGDGYAAGVRSAYQQVVDAALARRAPGQALVALGHLHIRGASVSTDSERRLVIGGEEALDASLFPPELAYVALGHLHKPQSVGQDRIRYCGSPLPLSFSEIHYPHQVLEIHLEGDTLASVETHRVPRPAHILRVPTKPEPWPQVLEALRALDISETLPGLEPLLEVQLLASIVPTDLRFQVDEALSGKRVRLTGINRTAPTRQASDETGIDQPARLAMEDLQPDRLFQRLLDEHDDLPDKHQLLDAFAELLQDIHQKAG